MSLFDRFFSVIGHLKLVREASLRKKTMYLLDLSLQHTNINSQSFQLEHEKAQFLIFAEANLPNCDLESRRSARYLKILEEFREILQYWWETSSYSTAFDHLHYESLEQQYDQQMMMLTRKIILQNPDKCCPS